MLNNIKAYIAMKKVTNDVIQGEKVTKIALENLKLVKKGKKVSK